MEGQLNHKQAFGGNGRRAIPPKIGNYPRGFLAGFTSATACICNLPAVPIRRMSD